MASPFIYLYIPRTEIYIKGCLPWDTKQDHLADNFSSPIVKEAEYLISVFKHFTWYMN